MKVLLVAQEAVPFYKMGGLGDVIGALTKELGAQGVDARVMLPQYIPGEHPEAEVVCELEVVFDRVPRHVKIKRVDSVDGIRCYLAEESTLITTYETGLVPEADRYTLFDAIVAAWLAIEVSWKPHVVHVHDWHTSLVPMLLKSKQVRAKTMLTVHNANYQGYAKAELIDKIAEICDFKSLGWDTQDGNVNFLLQGLIHADMVTTVSERYAKEVLTEEYGAGLQEIFSSITGKFKGILNGIDLELWNPQTDAYLDSHYDVNTWMRGKAENKKLLQEKWGLPLRPDVPLMSFVGRVDSFQKGISLLLELMNSHLFGTETEGQLLILGKGDPIWERQLQERARDLAGVRVNIMFDEKLARLLYAGSDMMVIPSQYEPCGLVQMNAMRYGTVPIVRMTGGLAETVDINCGFLFENYAYQEFEAAVTQAVMVWKKPEQWKQLVETSMNKDFSWKSSAQKYIELYHQLLES